MKYSFFFRRFLFFIFIIIAIILFFNYYNNKNLSFILEQKDIIEHFKEKNFFLFFFLFFIVSLIWVIFIGIGTPITLFSGFFLGNIFGTILALLSLSIGSTIFFIFLKKYFLKRINDIKIIKKNKGIVEKIRKKEFEYFLLFRLAGGLKFPLMIQNIIPISFNMKLKNFFLSTILGMGPSTFINVSIGKAFRNYIENNDKITFFEIIRKSEIYLPIIGMIILITMSYFIKKKYFNDQ